MIFRFSLYGFLKNQRYYEAFIVLAFLERGLDFFQIGLLVALRELAVTVLEVPSGAIADVHGRRSSMVLSFAAYITGFVVLGFADSFAFLLSGMLLLGVGDAFRTGTHKAMIFTWLRLRGRTDERVRVYGFTRSWSKLGSAASVIIAAGLVIAFDGYRAVFLATVVPYAVGIANLLTYPRELDPPVAATGEAAGVLRHMTRSIALAVRRPHLRRLLVESTTFAGLFNATKDYLQPVLAAAAISLGASMAALDGWSDPRRTALLVAPVYMILFILSALASRSAHRLSDAAGGDDRAAALLLALAMGVYAMIAVADGLGTMIAVIAAFVVLHAAHSMWHPVLISRFDARGEDTRGASLLSIESQARRVSTMIIAPLLGLAVDAARTAGSGGGYWPVGVAGLLIAVPLLMRKGP